MTDDISGRQAGGASPRNGDPRQFGSEGRSDAGFERLLSYLREVRGFDFTGYKHSGLMRRVRHRMQQLGILTFGEYHDYLQQHPDEFSRLLDAILVNVTSFFRDIEAWDQLATATVPELVSSDGPIRAWSAGCATGQEAYSLAIALFEALGPSVFGERVKIYATDIDDDALAIAQDGCYSEKEVRRLPDGYLQRHFDPLNGRYAVREELRRNVIFGHNDLARDAPIMGIDLLVCRNTLMYFDVRTRVDIESRLAFALKPRGVLFLGKAESLLGGTAAFRSIDLRRRLLRKVEPSPGQAAPASPSALTRGPRFDEDAQALRTEVFLTGPVSQLVVDEQDRLALVNHRAASLLAISEGDIGRTLFDLGVSYRPAELMAELASVRDTRMTGWLRDVEWRRSADDHLIVDIQLVPLADATTRLLGIALIFNEVSQVRQLQEELRGANRQLETAYQQLQSTSKELESTNEELQSTVEELEATSDELQSANQELDVMSEELLSMNDEFRTTNAELRRRINEAITLNDFAESILESLDVAIVVVSTDLLVQVWNRQAEELWGLREVEALGQDLLNLVGDLPAERLRPMIREAVTGMVPTAEVRVQAINRWGRNISLRITVIPLISEERGRNRVLLLMEQSTRSDVR